MKAKRIIFSLIAALMLGGAVTGAALLLNGDASPASASLSAPGGRRTLTVGGQAFGVKFYTQGVIVVDMTSFETAQGMRNPAQQAGVRVGDVILSVDGMIVSTNADIADIVGASGGRALAIELSREGERLTLEVDPLLGTAQKEYKLGLWVRDSTAGVGTVTYIDPLSGRFGALGHGISDVDTGMLMPLSDGDVLQAHITSVAVGRRGSPGQLKGAFVEDTRFGSLSRNTEQGVFGSLEYSPLLDGEEYPVAEKGEVHTGAAKIRCTVSGTSAEEYAVEIDSINGASGTTRNFVVRVTDERLLAVTGGIVQGMSGSPILQDGRIVGALTHVFIGDPTMGYGIYIGNMLAADAQ